MNPERWEEVQALFEAALEQEPTDRTAYLRGACNGDDDLFREVTSLLDADDQGHSLLEGHALDALDDLDLPVDHSLEGARVGPYCLLRLIGEGGMGHVYQAERADGVFEQQVALKLIKRGMDTAQIVRRFQAERQILARLQHENIARLLDGGINDDGLPYFVMEYVDGMPIDQYCDVNRLSIDERLDLFVTVCKTVLYAHANLVVHRDLKPENILVTRAGKVKLLDFGIAKVLGGDEDQTQLTQVGGRVLTPGYASPEQLRGEAISTSSDIYSLGVVLYELLSGQRPYVVTGAIPDALAQVLDTTEPERPSTVVVRTTHDADTVTAETISQARGLPPEKLRRRLSGDLDVICLKALRKEPERRYGSAETFAEDIRRHLTGLPVHARRDTLGYRTTKFVRRHRLGLGLTAAIVLLVTGLVSFYTWQLTIERNRATQESQKAGQAFTFMVNLFNRASPQAGGTDVSARELLDQGTAQVDSLLADQPEVYYEMLKTIGMIYRYMGAYDAAEPLLRKLVALNETIFKEPAVPVIQGLSQLASVLQLNGAYDEAEIYFEKALQVARDLPEYDPFATAYTLNNLAKLRLDQGRYDIAEAPLREAASVYEEAVGSDHFFYGVALRNLARSVHRQGRLREANSLYQTAIATLRSGRAGAVNSRQSALAEALHELARHRIELGRYDEAEVLNAEATSIRRELYGDSGHADVAQSLTQQGVLRRVRGAYDETEALHRDALALFTAAFDSTHPTIGYVLADLGTLSHAQGRHDEAAAHYEEALAQLRGALPAGHPDVATALQGLGYVRMAQGRPGEAEPLLRDAVVLLQRRLAPNHWLLASAQNALGACLAELGQTQEALPLLRNGYETLRSGLGEEAPATREAFGRVVAHEASVAGR